MIETDNHVIIVRPKKVNARYGLLHNWLKPKINDYGITLSKNEEIETAHLKQNLIITEYLYYDDPEETDKDRRKYIERLKIDNPSFNFLSRFSEASVTKHEKIITSIKRVKNETPFNYQPNSIK